MNSINTIVGLGLFAFGFFCGVWFGGSGDGKPFDSSRLSGEADPGHFPREDRAVVEPVEAKRGIVLPVVHEDLLKITADRLMRATGMPFVVLDPEVFAFVHYADRSTLERVTDEFFKGGPSLTRMERAGVFLLAQAWARIDPEAGLAARESFADSRDRSNWSQAVFYAWMTRDYATAMKALDSFEAEGSRSGNFRDELMAAVMISPIGLQPGFEDSIDPAMLSDHHLRGYLELLASRDVLRAKDFLSSLPENKKDLAESILLEPLAREDPLGALQAASEMPERRRAVATTRVYGAWASMEPSAAAVHAFANDAPADVRQRVLRSWIYQDVAGAAAFLRSSVSETERAVLLERAFDRVSGSSRLREMEPLLKLMPLGAARDKAVGTFLRSTFSMDPEAALRRFDQELANGAGQNLAQGMLYAQGMTDAVAIKVLKKLAPGDRDRAAQSLAQMQMPNGVTDALKFRVATEIADSNTRRWAVQSLLRNILRQGPEQAIELLQSLPTDHGERASYYNTVAQGWADKDPDAALAWAEQLELDDKSRAQTVGRVLERIARNSPDLALKKARSFEDAALRREALEAIARPMSDRNPEEFAGYMAQLPNSETSPKVYREIAAAWLKKDPLNGSVWVDSLPQGENRDQAVTGLVDSLRSSDPESAFRWAASLGAGRHRQQMLRNTLSSLSQNDPQVALKVFEEVDLSEQDRKAIQHVLP